MANNNETTDPREYVNHLINVGANIQCDEDDAKIEIELPDYYDKEKFNRGVDFYLKNKFATGTGAIVGLISVFAIPSILRVLIQTNNSSTPMTAYRRYVETLFHTTTWYDKKLGPGRESFKSIEYVRKRHLMVTKQGKAANGGIVSQKDLVLTQFGFMGYVVLRARMLGIAATQHEMEAFIHVWRVLGYLLGIKDEFNLCSPSFKETWARLEIIINEIYRPALERKDDSFHQMTDAMCCGLWCFNPFIYTDKFIFFTRRLCLCKDYIYYESDLKQQALEYDYTQQENKILENHVVNRMGWLARFNLWVMIAVHQYALRYTLVRWYLNWQSDVSKFLITYFPFLAFYQFGIKNSYVRILKNN